VPRQPGSGPLLSEIVLIHLNLTISAHWDKFTQNRWFFAISLNIGGSKYFTRKCGGFLELTPDFLETKETLVRLKEG
jgi:hypothetical protein